jgi:hypothetical protein
MNSYRTFVIAFFTIFILVFGSTASFIYFMDPMWTFNHKHKWNDVQTVINERQQKTNAIHFQPFDYDSLLIGSSRSTYINQHDFTGMKVYNYAVSNMSVREYNSFIEYAKKERGSEFKTVLIGVDFFKSSLQESKVPLSLDSYIKQMNSPLYRYKNLVSYDLLKLSKQNFEMSKNNQVLEERDYNRNNVANAKKVDPKVLQIQTKAKIAKFKQVFYGKTYQYNPNYKSYLMELKKNNPNTKFIVYTTPISAQLFAALVEERRLPDYKQWLEDITEVFGGVENFMYPNEVSNDITNYFDGHHFYPPVGKMIAHRLSGVSTGVPKDFGMYMNKDNFNQKWQLILKQSKQKINPMD